MTKIIKEIILMLLTCLAGMLLFAVVFYNYIPNRKIVPEIAVYNASEKIKELKSDDIDKRNETIIKTFQVTSSDLTNYKIANDYVAGKSNPFGSAKTNPDAGSSTKNGGMMMKDKYFDDPEYNAAFIRCVDVLAELIEKYKENS